MPSSFILRTHINHPIASSALSHLELLSTIDTIASFPVYLIADMARPKKTARRASRFPRRATPAPTVSDITEVSRSPSPLSEWMDISHEHSSAPSDMSDGLVAARSPSPPPGFAHMPQNSWTFPQRTSRFPPHASFGSSNITELTVISAAPTPSPEVPELSVYESIEVAVEGEVVTITKEAIVQLRDTNGRFVPKRARPQTSSKNERYVLVLELDVCADFDVDQRRQQRSHRAPNRRRWPWLRTRLPSQISHS